MNRSLKSLGVTLIAILVASVPAASASTPGEITVFKPAYGTGTEIAGKVNALTAFGLGVECPGSTYHIRKWASPLEPIPNASTTVTVTPTYNNFACKTSSGLKATTNTNSCDFVFHVGETVGGGAYGVTADIICPTEQGIDIEVYASASNENIKVCTLTVKPQNGLTGPVLTNGTVGFWKDVTLSGTFKNLHVEESGLCGSNTTFAGELHVNITITARNAASEEVDISVSD